MKKITILTLIIISQFTFSQATTKISSIDNGGGNFNSGTLSIIYTIGETTIQEYTTNTLKVSEGFIGEKQLLNRDTENLNCVTPPNNLISWWKAEDNANDSAGSNHGTINGATYATGVVDKSFLFDGVNDVVVVPHSTDLDITGDITVEFWALQTVFNAENTVLCKGSEDEENTFSIRFSGQIFECVFKDNTGTDIVLGGPSFEDFQWHHYAYVRQGNQHQIYADGFGFGWETFINSPESSSGLPLTMGAQYNEQNNNYVNFFGGQLDEISVYNRALSQTEIQSVYNAGANGKCTNALRVEDEILAKNTIKIYPNPVTETLNIQFNESQHSTITISDIHGKTLNVYNNSSRLLNINMNDKTPGLYFVSVQGKDVADKVFKIVKR